jgi:hypothetical protein
MATIINSSTNPQGLIQTSDGTAVLKIQTGGNDAIVFDSSQNVTVNNDLTVSGNLAVTGTTTLSDLDFSNPVFSGNVTVQAQGDVRFADADSSNFVALQAPSTIASNFTLTLPSATGSANQVLQTDGSGNLGFVTPVTGASTGKAIAMSIVFG